MSCSYPILSWAANTVCLNGQEKSVLIRERKNKACDLAVDLSHHDMLASSPMTDSDHYMDIFKYLVNWPCTGTDATNFSRLPATSTHSVPINLVKARYFDWGYHVSKLVVQKNTSGVPPIDRRTKECMQG